MHEGITSYGDRVRKASESGTKVGQTRGLRALFVRSPGGMLDLSKAPPDTQVRVICTGNNINIHSSGGRFPAVLTIEIEASGVVKVNLPPIDIITIPWLTFLFPARPPSNPDAQELILQLTGTRARFISFEGHGGVRMPSPLPVEPASLEGAPALLTSTYPTLMLKGEIDIDCPDETTLNELWIDGRIDLRGGNWNAAQSHIEDGSVVGFEGQVNISSFRETSTRALELTTHSGTNVRVPYGDPQVDSIHATGGGGVSLEGVAGGLALSGNATFHFAGRNADCRINESADPSDILDSAGLATVSVGNRASLFDSSGLGFVLRAGQGAFISAHRDRDFAPSRVERVEGAEIQSLSPFRLQTLSDVIALRSADSVGVRLPARRRTSSPLEDAMSLGGRDEADRRSKRAAFWSAMVGNLEQHRASGDQLSRARYAAARARRRAVRRWWDRERILLSLYSSIGYGERIGVPLIYYVVLAVATAVVLDESWEAPFGPAVGDLPIWELIAVVLGTPFTFFRFGLGRTPASIGPQALLALFGVVGVVLLFFAISAVRRVTLPRGR